MVLGREDKYRPHRDHKSNAMKKLSIFIILGAAVICAFSLVPRANAAYSYYRAITVTSTNTVASGTNSNFPMLVSNTLISFAASSSGSGHIQNLCTAPNGGQEPCDLIFTSDSACAVPLNFETESYTSSTGALVDWVNVPTMQAGAVIYACYGSSAVTTDQSHPSATWNAGYKGVWHLPAPTSTLSAYDSTGVNNATAITNVTATSTGQIDGAANASNTATTAINVGHDASINITGTALSISAWINARTLGGGNVGRIVSKSDTSTTVGYNLAVNSNQLRFTINSNTGNIPGTGFVTGTLQYVVVTFDGSNRRGYVNSVQGSPLALSTSTASTPSLDLGIGGSTVTNSRNFDGVIDEVRISNVVRTPSWILTEYNNQFSPSTFYMVGGETAIGVPAPGPPGTPTYTGVGTTTLTVNWTASTNTDYYKIERATSSQSYLQVGTTSALSYADSGLTASTTYFYRVRGTSAGGGDGPYSASSSVTTAAAAVIPPNATSVSTTIGGDGGLSGDSITITGTNFGTVSGGSRATCNGASGTGCIKFIVGGTDTVPDASISSWSDTSITFTVSSTLNSNGGVAALQVWVANASDTTPLTFYIYPNITSMVSIGTYAARTYSAGDTDGLIMLSGDHFGAAGTSTVLGYAATQHGATGGSCSVAGYASTSVCLEVPTAIPSSTYSGTIILNRTSDNKQSTTTLSILPRVISVSPTSTYAGQVVQVLGDHLCQGGTCPVSPNRSSATNKVMFGTATSSDSDFVNTTGGGGVCNGGSAAWVDGEICVKVPAAASVGSASTTVNSNGAISNLLSFTVTSPPAPGTPGTPTYTNVGTTTLTVNWTSSANTDYYKIERATSSQSYLQVGTTSALFYADSGLTASTAYFYRVRGTSAGGGDGPYSASSSVTTAAGGGGGGGGGSGYSYYRAITVTSTNTVASGTNSNFPMLVSNTLISFAASSSGSGHIQNLCTAPNGGQEPCDLIFTSDSACAVPLNFETESYTSSTGALVDWVNVPTMQAGAVIYACYGSSAVTTDQSHPSATWNAGYKGVWHLPAPTSTLSAYDSTGVNNATAITNVTATSTGQIDGAANASNTATTAINVGHDASINITGTALSISAWINARTLGGGNVGRIVSKSDTSTTVGYNLAVNSNQLRFTINSNTGNIPGTGFVTGTLQYVVVTFDGSNRRGYVNSVQGSPLALSTSTASTPSLDLGIGGSTVTNSRNFDGVIDEVRISNVVRTPSWILTEYNNQFSPSTFYMVGGETVLSVANSAPAAPSEDVPVSNGQDVSTTPVFKMTATDSDGNALQYKVTVYSNAGCTTVVQANDEGASQTGWSGQNTSSSNEYTSGTQGTYAAQAGLLGNTVYYWRASAKDPEGTNTWTDSASCNSFATTYGNWTTDSGNWSISANQLVVAPNSGSSVQLHAVTQNQTNAVLEFKAKASNVGANTGNSAGILRADSGANRYHVSAADFLNQREVIAKTVSNIYNSLASTSFTFSAGTFYESRGSLSGTTLNSWLNGGNAITTADAALASAGFAGLTASSTNGSATFTFDDFALYNSTIITMNNLPGGGSWSIRDHSGTVISCRTTGTWDLSTYTGQVPIDYDNSGGSVAVWAGSASCSGAPDQTYPSAGLATDIFGGDTYAYSASSSGAQANSAVVASSSITISSVGGVGY